MLKFTAAKLGKGCYHPYADSDLKFNEIVAHPTQNYLLQIHSSYYNIKENGGAQLKKNGLLHRELMNLICSAGHGDYIMITDRGFPLPITPYTKVIDLGLAPGFPDFDSITKLIFPEIAVDWIYFTEEAKESNPKMIETVKSYMPKNSGFSFMKHTHMKEAVLNPEIYNSSIKGYSNNESRENAQLLDQSRIIGFIRTGEFTKYTNILIECGVAF